MSEPLSMRDRLERLRRLGVQRGVEGIQPPPPPPREPRRRADIAEVVGGVDVTTPHGACFIADTRYPEHAGLPVGEPPSTGHHVARLTRDASLDRLDLRRAAFVDIETTGLGGGTGTLAFLVGVGSFEGDAFRVRQFFLRDPGDELAQLHALDEWLSQFSGIVSFNGRAFDMPLLTTRYRLARRRAPLATAPHLDLLLPARRLWRARLGSCALGSLERGILGVERTDDVPGMIIPYIYFDYVRHGTLGRLERVFYHNALDIVSMAALLTRMCDAFDDPWGNGVSHGADWLSLGIVYEAAGAVDQAVEAYEHAMRCQLPPELHEQAKERWGQLCKREGAWDRAVAEWVAAIDTGTARRLYPYVELAKYYEHRARDYTSAIVTVRRAIDMVRASQVRHDSLNSATVLAELEHRLARLERKAARGSGSG